MTRCSKDLAKMITLSLLLTCGGVQHCAAADYTGTDTLDLTGNVRGTYDNVAITKVNSSGNFTGVNLSASMGTPTLTVTKKISVNISDNGNTNGYNGIYNYAGTLKVTEGVDITINSTAAGSNINTPWRVGLNHRDGTIDLGKSSHITIDTVHAAGYVNGIYATEGTIKGTDLNIAVNQNLQDSQTQTVYGSFIDATSNFTMAFTGALQIDTKAVDEATGMYIKGGLNETTKISSGSITINSVASAGAAMGIRRYEALDKMNTYASDTLKTDSLNIDAQGKTEAYGLDIGKRFDVTVKNNTTIKASADDLAMGLQLSGNDYFNNSSSFTGTGVTDIKAVAQNGSAYGVKAFTNANNQYGQNTVTMGQTDIEATAANDAYGIDIGRNSKGTFGAAVVKAASAAGDAYGINTHNENEYGGFGSQKVKFNEGLQASAVAANGSAYAVNAKDKSNVYIHKGLQASAVAADGEDAYALKADVSSKIKINEKEEQYAPDDGELGAVQINGNILSTDSSYISAFLSSADSFLSGSSKKDSGSTINLAFGDGARWNMTDASQVNDLTVGKGTVIDMSADKGVNSTLAVDNLTGSGADFIMDINKDGHDALIVSGTSAEGDHSVNLNVNGIDALKNLAASAEAFISTNNANTKFTMGEGFSGGLYEYAADLSSKVDATGKTSWYVDNLSTKVSDAVFTMAATNQVAYTAWTDGNGSLRQRLGELQSGADNGVWARMFGGKLGGDEFTNKYKTYQLGYDTKAGDWRIGAAYEYSDGSLDYANGSGDNKIGAVSLYGTLQGKDNSAVDIVVKRGRIYGDLDLYGKYSDKGDYSTDATSLGVEYTKRFDGGNDVYFEPQAQLTFGRIDAYDYTSTKGIRVSYDDLNSLVGRLGVVAGKEFSRGAAYVKASVLHEFSGDGSVTMLAANGDSYSADQDYGDTWLEVGLGGNIALGKNCELYGDVERSFGGEVTKNWGANVGFRYSF